MRKMLIWISEDVMNGMGGGVVFVLAGIESKQGDGGSSDDEWHSVRQAG